MIELTRNAARRYRGAMVAGAQDLPDDEAVRVPMLFDRWVPGRHYVIGQRLYYDGRLYDVLQEHDSHEAYPPDVTVSLYAEVLIPDPSVIPDWVQPSSTNPYMRGDRVRHVGHIWLSEIDNNIWEPGSIGSETLWVIDDAE